MTLVYSLRGVQQAYAGQVVLDIAELDVLRGEVLAVVGPSGAGKSTLLRLLNFLEPPSAGQLSFLGRPVPADPPLELVRRATTVFQRPVLLNRSVHDNVAYGLQLRGLSTDGQVTRALEQVGLQDLARRRAPELSGGEMQRAALARALVLQPEVLLLDEPTANLDPYNVGLIERIIREENQSRGTTVVLVTHNVFQAHRLATRVALLLAGQLVETAPAEVFFETPRDARTRAFVRGEMVY